LPILKGSKIHRTAAVGLIFFALFFVTPEGLLTAAHIAERYVIPCFLLLLLSIEPRWGLWQRAALGLLLIAMAARLVNITTNWVSIDRASKQVLALGGVLPERASVYVLVPVGDAYLPPLKKVSIRPELELASVTELWAVSHEADVSGLFAFAGQQPLVLRQPPYRGQLVFGVVSKNFVKSDFVWTYDPPPSYRQAISRIATPAATWEKATLWRVNHPVSREQRVF
jgi:hypothetical protein